jgi:hypothetical protein
MFIYMRAGDISKKIYVVHLSLIRVNSMLKVNLKEMFAVVCITCPH